MMKIALVQIGDMHFCGEQSIQAKYNKISNSLLKYGKIDKIIIILMGDLTFSGKNEQFISVKRLISNLIYSIKKNNICHEYIEVLCVPGNHDINHKSEDDLTVQTLNNIYKNNLYEKQINEENEKMKNFYYFAKKYDCFTNNKMFCRKVINIKDYKIEFNLINSALFSLKKDEDKGLHYLDNESIECFGNGAECNLSISVCHHSIEFFAENIKKQMDSIINKNSHIFLYAHEHSAEQKEIISNKNSVIYQLSGALGDSESNEHSTYNIGIVNTDTNEYEVNVFSWDQKSNIYIPNQQVYEIRNKEKSNRSPQNEYIKNLFKDDCFDNEDSFVHSYVFPRLASKNSKTQKLYLDNIKDFVNYLESKKYMVILGAEQSGKSALLKRVFLELINKKTVIYCDINTINTKKISNVIQNSFHEIYGIDEDYEKYTQTPISEKVILIDDVHKINKGKLSSIFSYLSSYFGTILLTSLDTIEFDIVEKMKEINDVNLSFSSYRLTSFQKDKRNQLITNVLYKNGIDEVEKKTHEYSDYLDSLKKFIPYTPLNIINYIQFICTHQNDFGISDSSAYSKVFESSITSALNKNIKGNITVEKMYMLYSELAYYSHINLKNVISDKELLSVLEKYNKEYKGDVIFQDFIDVSEKSKIYYFDRLKNGYKFKKNEYQAYFVASKIQYELANGENQEDFDNIIKNSFNNINSDILMFITYLSKDIKIIKYLYEKAEQLTSEWEELNLSNLPNFMNHNDIFTIDDYDLLISKQDKIEQEVKKELNGDLEIVVNDAYDYNPSESEKDINQLLRAMSLLVTISKCLPSFEHMMKAELKDRIVSLIYKMPNRIFNFWAKKVDEDYMYILSEYLSQNINNKYLLGYKTNVNSLEAKNDIDNAAVFVRNSSLNLLLELYFLPIVYSARKNTFTYLDTFKYDEKDTYKLEHLMVLERCGKYEKMISDLIEYAQNSKEFYFFELIQKIAIQALPYFESINGAQDKIIDKIIDSKKVRILKIEAKTKKIDK